MVTQKPTFIDGLNKSRAMYGLGPIGAGTTSALGADFGTTVVGGTAMCVGVPLAFKGAKKLVWDLPKWTYQNYGNYRQGFGTLLTNYKTGLAERKALNLNLKGDNWFQSVGNRMQYNNLAQLEAQLPTDLKTGFDKSHYYKLKAENPTEATKYLEKFKEQKTIKKLKVDCYGEARAKLADIKAKVGRGELKGKQLKDAIADLNQSISKGDIEVQKLIQEGKIKPTSRLGKIGANLKKFTGVNAITKAMNNTIAKGAAEGATKGAKAAATACKGAKAFVKGGGAFTAIIEAGFDTYENWEIYKTGTTKQKWKQAGKTAAVATGAGVGWWAGHAAGAALGGIASAAIAGSAIGSVVPGLGTVIGAVIGIGCGLIGSWLGSKAAKAAVGPSELEKKKNADSTKLALAEYDALLNGRGELLEEGIISQEHLDIPA